MATPTLAQARSHYQRQRLIVANAVRAARQAFKRNRPLAEIAALVAAYQAASATASATSVAAMAGDANPFTIARVFAGVSSKGFPLIEPLVATIDQRVPAPVEPVPDNWWEDRLAEFLPAVEQLIEAEVADAGRSAGQVEIVARPDWTNYVRMLNPPSCPRCTILAGRVYRDLDGFERHPQCFPAGVVVSGPTNLAATRRWYEGELVILRTASGQELPATGNHPVLTDQGWIPANLLKVGDQVVRSTRPEGALPLVVPDEQQAPALIEDVRGSDGMVPLDVVPTAPKDFHGDGGHGEVDIVFADRLLWNGFYSAGTKLAQQVELTWRVTQPPALAGSRSGQQLALGLRNPTDSLVGSGSLNTALFGGHSAGAHDAGLGHAANLDPLLDQAGPDDVARYAVAEAERVLALASEVRRRDVGARQLLDAPRWDAPAGPLSEQNRGAYASRGLDLGRRLSGQVHLDRLVEVRRVSWSGHVYNLTSAEGWFSANSLIVSNCDCVHVPVTDWEAAHDAGLVSSPQEAFDKGHIRGLSRADAQAIRDGADIGQVINAHRGMRTADVFGRRVKATMAGTTKRSAWRRANPTRLVRLRPEAIYQIVDQEYGGDREQALRLLRLYGYLTS